jgi:hypothetical protein
MADANPTLFAHSLIFTHIYPTDGSHTRRPRTCLFDGMSALFCLALHQGAQHSQPSSSSRLSSAVQPSSRQALLSFIFRPSGCLFASEDPIYSVSCHPSLRKTRTAQPVPSFPAYPSKLTGSILFSGSLPQDWAHNTSTRPAVKPVSIATSKHESSSQSLRSPSPYSTPTWPLPFFRWHTWCFAKPTVRRPSLRSPSLAKAPTSMTAAWARASRPSSSFS